MSGGTTGSEDSDKDGPGGSADSRDFAAVYKEQADSLHSYAASLLHGAGLTSQAGDVVQDAVERLWKRYKATGEVPRNWAGAMMRYVWYAAMDLLKGPDVKHARFSMNEDDSTFDKAAPGDFTGDHAVSVPVLAAFATLDHAQHREVLYRIYYEDKTQTQVAEDMGLTKGRITQIKQAALKQLAANIDED